MTGLEPAASGVTGRRSNQLSYTRIWNRATDSAGREDDPILSVRWTVKDSAKTRTGTHAENHTDAAGEPGVSLPRSAYFFSVATWIPPQSGAGGCKR